MAGTVYANIQNLIEERFPDIISDEGKESIALMVESVSRFVDNYLNKPFGYFLPSPAIGVPRNFRGDGTKILRLPKHIKDTVSITNLDITDWYESLEGHLYRGKSILGQAIPDGWVFEFNFNTYDQDTPFWIDNRLYVVTARWGYEETPADISEAVMQIVYRWWKTQAGTLGQITPTGFLVERDIPKAAKAILDNYIDKF